MSKLIQRNFKPAKNWITKAIKKKKAISIVYFLTYFSHMLGLTVKKSGAFLPFAIGVELIGPGTNHEKETSVRESVNVTNSIYT